MTLWSYTRGVHEVANGVYAYLQPDGSWGWSNAGLVVTGHDALLIDTLFDPVLTREMLRAMREATPAVESIRVLVNTHANGDHCNGNQLLKEAEIIASRACAEEFATQISPHMMAQLLKGASQMGPMGAYFSQCFGAFRFDDVIHTPPTRTFEGELQLNMGSKEIRLLEVGPCHTKGDTIVHLLEEGIVFAGDILFHGGTPIMWEGPVENWIRACDRILALDAEVIVPGHGPIADRQALEQTKEYWQETADQARKLYDQGIPAAEATQQMAAGRYKGWGNPERIVINVATLYRQFSGDPNPLKPLDLFGAMGEMTQRKP